MAKKHRLFKVARELNTGSSTLIEHLNANGFEVENNLNAKLSEEMYSTLLKEFASEKALKQKAEQIKEKKREERLAGAEKSGSEEEDQILSAADLKSGILEQEAKPMFKKRTVAKAKVDPPVEPKTESPPIKVEIKPEAKAEEVQPVAKQQEETPLPEDKTEKAGVPGLKVVDKIDLSQFERKRTKKAEKKAPVKKEKPADPVKKEAAKPKEEVKPVSEPASKEKPISTQPPVKVEAKPVPEKKDEKPASPITPEKEEKTEKSSKEVVAASEDENGVVRAADHTPKLAGLKVLGSIKLPSDKSKSKDKSDDDPKKKRRRKRKRKKPAVATNQGQPKSGGAPNRGGGGGPNRGGPNRGGGRGPNRSRGPVKREEPTDKEIKDKIKRTLADIDARASRSRQRIRRDKRQEGARRREREADMKEMESMVLEVSEFITANELANLMDITVTALITKCMEVGVFVSINQRLEGEIIELLADEYGYVVDFIEIEEASFDEEEEVDEPEDLIGRAPIITVMGHVDHGKTSLLDYIRKENVIAGEAGGITQHVGAYEVTLESGQKIAFLDTPGHEAFTAMRARGAKVTDLVIIVIAADDNVMPQTKEAINHAQAAGVPMVFAINKMDKPGANSDRIRTELSEMNILLEDWGGKFQSQEISAKTGMGIDELLEKVVLEAEMLELKANPEKLAKGTVIEARLDRGRGMVATILVQDGTLKVGDTLVAGVHYGRVRALMDERGNRIKSAGPSTPVQLLGLSGAPQAGDRFVVYKNEKKAKEIANKRNEVYREQIQRQTKRLSLEEIARRSQIGEVKDLNIIVKGDVDGSIEALSDSLLKLTIDEVIVNVVRKAVGQISEADVLLASASDAVIIGFQVRPSIGARRLAEEEGVEIRLYSIIYDAINEVKDALEGMLSPELQEVIGGSAQIREVFKISKVGNIAGCMVVDGSMNRKDPIRIIRDGVVVYTGRLAALKRFKDDAKEVKTGFECGIQLEGYNDIKMDDVIEQYHINEIKRKLGK